MFLDIKPFIFYITILKKFDLSNRCDITGRKPHLRKASDGIYKFDFGENNILSALTKGYSIEINNNTTFDEIKTYINRVII